jgi:hypothetical protein
VVLSGYSDFFHYKPITNNGVGSRPASSTTRTGRHNIAEILLKVALNTNKLMNEPVLVESLLLNS